MLSIWERLPRLKPKRESNYENSQNHEDDDIIPDNNNKIQIIIDDPAEEDALDFRRYSQNLANIIRTTKPKFAVGIFGKWGTGKTTLMRMIERELNPVLTLAWDSIAQDEEE